jgi:hypothetical protein
MYFRRMLCFGVDQLNQFASARLISFVLAESPLIQQNHIFISSLDFGLCN